MDENLEKELQEVKNALNDYEIIKNKCAQVILNIAKKDCVTYSQVEEKLSMLRRQLLFKQEDREKYQNILDRAYVLLEKEKSDLPVTNHF